MKKEAEEGRLLCIVLNALSLKTANSKINKSNKNKQTNKKSHVENDNTVYNNDSHNVIIIIIIIIVIIPVSSIFPYSPLPSGTWQLQACPFPDVVFPLLPQSALSSFPFHCALQDGFRQT